MAELSDDVRQGFLRQRRSLMGISLTLAFYLQAGLKLEQLNVFGSSITITDPLVAETALWIGWTYLLVRYWQYLHDLQNPEMKNAYHDRMLELMRRAGLSRLREILEQELDAADPKKIQLKVAAGAVTSRSSRAWGIRFDGSISYRHTDGSERSREVDREVEIGGRPLRVARIRSVSHVIVTTRLVTEYYLPLVVGALPAAIKLYHW